MPAVQPRRALGAAGFAAIVLVGGAWLATTWGAPPSGWRPLDQHPDRAVFEAECGACHTLYHPSLLSAPGWRLVMAGLEEHFGEDASLPAGPVDRITALLVEQANGSWDTEAAKELRGQQDPAKPMATTGNRWWLGQHQGLEERARFERRAQPRRLRGLPPRRAAGALRGTSNRRTWE